MKPQPIPEQRPTCPRCRQPIVVPGGPDAPGTGCWCQGLVAQETRARFVLLQHPREARNPMGTARMAHLSLAGSSLLVGIDFAQNRDFQALLAAERERSVVLYPAPGARDIRELAGREPPPTIWVIDGTWSQAQKIWKNNPVLRSLPAYRIEPRQPSQYGFRSEPEPHCVSTIEAIAEMVDAVEGRPGIYDAMLAPFRALVRRQLSFANQRPRRRSRARPPRVFRLPEPLGAHPERAVLFYVEGNGWPAAMEPRPPTEILQAGAVRPATGDRLGAIIRPRHGLSPTALENLELGPDQLAGWIEPEEMAARWEAFRRPDDVWCGWGHFSQGLLAHAGVPTTEVVDLRLLCNRLLKGRVGRIEDTHQRLGLPPVAPAFPGRGGRRLAMLEAVWQAVLARVER